MRSRFSTSAILSSGLMLALLPASAGEVMFAPGPEVLFERELDENVLKQYETTTSSFGQSADMPREELLKKAQSIANNQDVLKIELLQLQIGNRSIPLLRITRLGRQKATVAKEKEWQEHAMRNLFRGKDFAGFTHKSSVASLLSGYMYFDEPGAIGLLRERYRGPGGEPVEAAVVETRQETISQHQFLRWIAREDCALEKNKWGWLIRSRDKWGKTTEGGRGHRLSWLSGDKRAVYIGSVGGEPDGLVPLYIERFPSSLPRDFKIDKTAWGREEMDFWLPKMQAATRSSDTAAARLRLSGYVGNLRTNVFVPVVQGADAHDASFQLLKEQVEFLTKWWEANKDRTYWDEKRQQLMAEGWTPEDYAAVIRKRQEEQKEALLNAPVADEKVAAALAALVARMERGWTERVESARKTFGPDCGAKLEKAAEGVWTFAWKQSDPGPLIVEKVTGPKLEKVQGERQYPLKATFTREYTDEGKSFSEQEVFHYDKLADRWVPASLLPR